MTEKKVTIFNTNNVYIAVSPRKYGYAYFAKKDFNIGEEVMRGWGKIIDHQTSHISVQIDTHKYYLPEKFGGRYWNHSCDPNTHIRTRSDGFPSLVASKKIKKGDEITYRYAMTEYRWCKSADENHVKCLCGQRKCNKKILSFSQLTSKQQNYLKKNKLCSKYLLFSDTINI